MKHLLLTTALVTATAAGVHAQSTDASTDTSAAPMSGEMFRAESTPNELRASDFLGMRVYAAAEGAENDAYEGAQDNWEDIGEINDVILNRDGEVQAVLVDIGGFLGIGERQVAVQMDALDFVSDSSTAENEGDFFLVLTADRAALEGAPAYGKAADEAMTDQTAAASDEEVKAEESTDTAAADTEVKAEEGTDTAAADTEVKAEEGTDTAAADTEVKAEEGTDTAAADTEVKAEDTTETAAAEAEAKTEEATESAEADVEKAGEEMEQSAENAAEKTGDAVENAADATAEAAADAGEEVKETAEAAGEKMEQTADAAGEKMEEAGDDVAAAADANAEAPKAEAEADATATADAGNTDAAATEETTETADAGDSAFGSDFNREGFSAAGDDYLTTENLTGARVYDTNDKWVGEISELIVDDSGKITDAIVDVGGFLGIGEKPVALQMTDLKILREDDGDDVKIYTAMAEDELKSMPEFEKE